MASTGTPIYPSATTYPGSNLFPGQGPLPILLVLFCFDDVTDDSPVWVYASPTRVRAFSISRTEGETGTATLTLDNRDRVFDPTFVTSPYYPNVRPLNRVWLREQFSGETQDLFKGYAESYEMQWPGGGWSDAICVLHAADEFKVLSLTQLPLTNPPRNTYQDVVAFDSPASYWTMDEDSATRVQPPAIVLQDTTAPAAGQDRTFLNYPLSGKPPAHKHHKPVGPKKKHYKVYDASGNRVYSGPRPLKRNR